VVANARQILHATATDQHDRVLLEIMTFARDVAYDLVAALAGQTNLGNLELGFLGVVV
jgi:hypothetical protein